MPALPPGFIAVHQTLLALVPQGLHRPFLPTLPADAPNGTGGVDYTRFIEWLGLPRFATGNPAPNWMDFFARRLARETRYPVVCRLVELLDFGAQPQLRELDLDHAWWELTFMPHVRLQPMPRLAREPDEAVAVWTDEQIQQSARSMDVAEALRRFDAGAKHMTAAGWNPRSVLSLLGFKVGRAGPPATVRHATLEACLILRDAAIPQSQRDFWGGRGTRRRVRAIRAALCAPPTARQSATTQNKHLPVRKVAM